ncbi:MAG: ATP-grasp domain-containing protein [Clostridia bacterium]|nr:ATP-grasp domain-containing protein [Clostridia bacterium]
MKKLAIIGGGRMAGIFAKNAREIDVETHCFSPQKGIIEKELFDYYYDIDVLNVEKVLEICKKIKIDGVVATTELTIAPAAYVAEKMNLIGIPFENAINITNKYHNRRVTQNVEGLCHPRYAEVYSIDEILKLNYNYPIILKPTSKGGKRGITVIRDESQIEEAFSYAMKESGNVLPFIVEEFIEGEMECSVESLSYKGKNHVIQVTEKMTSGAPHCVELAHHQPANISSKMREKIEDVIERALSYVGIENGPCHTEIKIKGEDIYLIEFNARPGGDHIAHPLTELSTGYPYIKEVIKIALDDFKDVNKELFLKKCAGVIFVTEQTKEFKKIFDECENYEWCYKKNYIGDELDYIVHNDGFNKNYFIYCSDNRPTFK